MLTFTCFFSEPAQPLQNTFIIGLCHTYIIYTTFDTLSPSTFTFFMLHAAGSILETSVQQHFQQFIRKHPYASRFIGWTWFVSFFTLTGPLFLAPYLKLADTVNVPVSLVGWALGVRPMILPVVWGTNPERLLCMKVQCCQKTREPLAFVGNMYCIYCR